MDYFFMFIYLFVMAGILWIYHWHATLIVECVSIITRIAWYIFDKFSKDPPKKVNLFSHFFHSYVGWSSINSEKKVHSNQTISPHDFCLLPFSSLPKCPFFSTMNWALLTFLADGTTSKCLCRKCWFLWWCMPKGRWRCAPCWSIWIWGPS